MLTVLGHTIRQAWPLGATFLTSAVLASSLNAALVAQSSPAAAQSTRLDIDTASAPVECDTMGDPMLIYAVTTGRVPADECQHAL